MGYNNSMKHPCSFCSSTPCTCGAQGYAVLFMEDLFHECGELPELMAGGEEEILRLGQYTLEQILDLENLEP